MTTPDNDTMTVGMRSLVELRAKLGKTKRGHVDLVHAAGSARGFPLALIAALLAVSGEISLRVAEAALCTRA